MRNLFLVLMLSFSLMCVAGCGPQAGSQGDENDPALGSDAAAEAAERENPASVN